MVVFCIPGFPDNPPGETSNATDVTYISARTYDPCKTDISLCERQKFRNATQYQILSEGKPLVLALNVKAGVHFGDYGCLNEFHVDELSKTALNSVRERLRKALNETEKRMPQLIYRQKDYLDGWSKDCFRCWTPQDHDPHFIVDRTGQPIKRADLSWKEVSLTLFIHFQGVQVYHNYVKVDYKMHQMIVTDGPRNCLLKSSVPNLEPEEDIEKLLAFV